MLKAFHGDLQDGQQDGTQTLQTSPHFFAAAAACLRCHVAPFNKLAEVHTASSRPSAILEHLPELVNLACASLHHNQLDFKASTGYTISSGNNSSRAACSPDNAANLVQLLEAASLAGRGQQQQQGDSNMGPVLSARTQHHPAARQACCPDDLLQAQFGLLACPVPCPEV